MALSWLAAQNIPKEQIVERALVHVPVYTFKYRYQEETYIALIEGATGQVFANIYPAKAEVPYRLIGGLAAVVYLCLASFPIIGALVDGSEGYMFGLLACSAAGVVAAPFIFALGAWVAAKV
jgi:hypothetical protein